jgi:hypothetical protein
MAVHWGSETCVPPLPKDDTDRAWRAHLIEWAGVVGLSSIREDNVTEWLWRLRFLSKTLGWEAAALCYSEVKGKHRKEWITLEILQRWVGLWTNWSNVTRKEWVKLRLKSLENECDFEVRQATTVKGDK